MHLVFIFIGIVPQRKYEKADAHMPKLHFFEDFSNTTKTHHEDNCIGVRFRLNIERKSLSFLSLVAMFAYKRQICVLRIYATNYSSCVALLSAFLLSM